MTRQSIDCQNGRWWTQQTATQDLVLNEHTQKRVVKICPTSRLNELGSSANHAFFTHWENCTNMRVKWKKGTLEERGKIASVARWVALGANDRCPAREQSHSHSFCAMATSLWWLQRLFRRAGDATAAAAAAIDTQKLRLGVHHPASWAADLCSNKVCHRSSFLCTYGRLQHRRHKNSYNNMKT